MDTNETDISENQNINVNKSCQPEEIMETEGTPDDVNSCEETIRDNGKSTKTKETLEILKVELVAHGKIATEVVEESSFIINKEHNDKRHITDNDIQIESNTIENIESVEADVEQGDGQKSVDTNVATATGLGLLAQYESDDDNTSSDSNSVIEVPVASSNDYRNQVVEINSDTDSDDSDSDVEYLNELRKTIEKRIETVDDDEEEVDGDDNEENVNKKRHKPKLKVKGEFLLEDLPPIQDLKITVPEDECIEFGKIHSIVDQLVLVSALPNSILLDLETVLFLEKGQKVLGEVFDVLGQVADPWYCVRFNSNKQIQEKQINVGDIVFVAPKTQYTQYVILSNLMQQKGSDASWENDIEPPPRFLDYSDDEQEQLARRQLRNKDRRVDNDDPSKRPRTTEEDEEVPSVSGRSEHSTQQRFHHSENRRGSGHYNSYSKQRNQAPNQQPQNYHRGSWHSNYYRQPFPSHYQPPTNYGTQPYPSQYHMPPIHNMPYAPLPTQYAAPPMMHQHVSQLMPNTFSVRPATLQGPHISHIPLQSQQQYSPSPPPPPGSQ